MTQLLGLPEPVLLLLPLAVAAGMDLYLTLLVLGLSTWLGAGLLSPESLATPSGTAALGFLLLLYLLEAAAELRPRPALYWHTSQLLLRPLGGVLLGLVILNGLPLPLLILGALAAGLVVAFIHVLTWGRGLLLRLRPPGRVSPVTLNLLLDTCALALVVLALERPSWSFLGCAALLPLLLFLGHPLHGVARFGFWSVWDGMRVLLGSSPWRTSDEMPRWVRAKMGNRPLEGLRGMRAAGSGFPGVGAFREGWLVELGEDPFFLFFSTRGAQQVSLGRLLEAEEWTGPLALRLSFHEPEGGVRALFLQTDATRLKSHKW